MLLYHCSNTHIIFFFILDRCSRLLKGRRSHLQSIDLSHLETAALLASGIDVLGQPTKYFEATNKIGKLYNYSCFERERVGTCSSYVAFKDLSESGNVVICRILHFLRVSTRDGDDQEVAKLHKYTTVKEKFELYSIDDGEPKSNMCYVKCVDLPAPLISAVDTEQPSKVWLLDVQTRHITEVPS